MNRKHHPTILVFSPAVSGGIAEYSFYQAEALKKAGAEVICLVSSSFLAGRKTDFEKLTCLPDSVEGSPGLVKNLRMAWRIILSRYVLAWQIIKLRPDLVLLDSYVEYLAPFWIDPHILLSRIFGICYAANLHDPVRSYEIGPKWWHRLSVWLAYLPLDFVLVHDKLTETSLVPSRVRVVQVPHGLFAITGASWNSETIRHEWGVKEGQKVFLSFGYVRDGKNLDLAIQALKQVSGAFLVVAGSVASGLDRPFAFYRQLAEELGVNERCHFFEGFVPDEELGRYFVGTNFVLLIYSLSFHSQSGVLNIAARTRNPVLASAAQSPLIESVQKYNLGIAVQPDSLEAVVEGMRRLISDEITPRWEEYEAFASWDVNAREVLKAVNCIDNS